MRNIILVGMPGSGKSTIGLMLQDILLDYTLYDTDSIIEKTNNLKISEIFEKYSEDYFRKMEYETIKMLCSGRNKIIAIGGGAFENPDTRSTLLNFGKVFYLKSDIDVLYYRISKENTRPLLECDNPKEVLEKLLKKRGENYQKAHYTINIEDKTPQEIVNTILEKFYEANSES